MFVTSTLAQIQSLQSLKMDEAERKLVQNHNLEEKHQKKKEEVDKKDEDEVRAEWRESRR